MVRPKRNPVRYSIPVLLILTLCIFLGERLSPAEVHNIDVDLMVSRQNTSLTRELAYLALGGLGFAGVLFARLRQGRRLRWNRMATVALCLLFAWCGLSVLWAPTPEPIIRRLCVIALIYVGAFGMAISWSQTQVLKFLSFSAAIDLTAGFASEVSYGYFTPWQSDYRFSGTLTANYEAHVCLLLIFSSLGLARINRGGNWFGYALSGYGLIMLLLTRSRGGLLAFVSVLVLYLLLTLNLRQRVFAVLGIGILVLAVLVSGGASPIFVALNRGGEGSQDVHGRGPLWDDLMTYVEKRPLLGYGYVSFWSVKRIDDVSSDQGWPITGAHSGYIENLLQIGWIGAGLHTIALLICMLAAVIRFRRKGGYTYFLTTAVCLIYMVDGLFEGITIVNASAISFYTALLLCGIAVRAEAETSPGGPQSVGNEPGGRP